MRKHEFGWLIVLVLVATNTAEARRFSYHRTSSCGDSRAADRENTTSYGPTCYCLQQKFLDYPGPYDLWECIYYPDGCDHPETAEADLYYGFPTNTPPQSCGSGEGCGTCESEYERASGKDSKADVPGHGLNMPTKDIAWRTFEEGLRGAGFDTAGMKPAYYMIPNPKLQEINRDVYVIVVELPSGKPGGTPRYLGLEMNPHQEELDPASFTKPVKLGRGKQIKVEYEASGEIRKMYVWLKN